VTMARVFEDTWRKTRSLIDEWIRDAVERNFEGEARKQVLASFEGGKRLRGTLAILHWQALTNRSLDEADKSELLKKLVVSVESIQTATLIHDDFVDRHESRRGEEPLYKRLDPRRAVLLGDAIFGFSQKLAAEDPDARWTLADCLYHLSLGAFSEPVAVGFYGLRTLLKDLLSGEMGRGIYLAVIAKKTGVLFATACRLGAVAARASAPLRDAAYNYGLKVGEAYQMADDLADLMKGEISLTGTFLMIADYKPEFFANILPPFQKIRISDLISSVEEIEPLVRRDIETRVEEGRRIIAQEYEPNRYTELLMAAPRAMVDMMLREGGADLG
jgi:geranylgeranyl pyrophosphate synthase